MTEINVCWQPCWIHILSKNWTLASSKCWNGNLERWTIKCRIHPPSLICCAECSARWYFTYQQEEPSDEVRKVFWVEKNTLKWTSELCQCFRCFIASQIHQAVLYWEMSWSPNTLSPYMWIVGCICLQLELNPTFIFVLLNPPMSLSLQGKAVGWPEGVEEGQEMKIWGHSPQDQNIAIYYFLITWS